MNYVNQQQYQSFVKPYVEGPVKEYGALQERLVKDYDEAAMQYDALQEAKDNMKYIKGSKGDEEAHSQIWEEATKQIDAAAKSGDYENKGRLVRKAIRDFSGSYKPLADRYAGYIENIKKISERQDLSEADKKADIEALKENYYNNVQYNNKGKVVLNSWQEYNPYKTISIEDKIMKYAEAIEKQKWEDLPRHQDIAGFDYLVSQTTTKKNKDLIYSLAKEYAKNDPEIQGYLGAEARRVPYKYNTNKLIQTEEFSNWLSKQDIAFSSKEEENNFNDALAKGQVQKKYITDKLVTDAASRTAIAKQVNDRELQWEKSIETELRLAGAKKKLEEGLTVASPGYTTPVEKQGALNNLSSSYHELKGQVGANYVNIGKAMRDGGFNSNQIKTFNSLLAGKTFKTQQEQDAAYKDAYTKVFGVNADPSKLNSLLLINDDINENSTLNLQLAQTKAVLDKTNSAIEDKGMYNFDKQFQSTGNEIYKHKPFNVLFSNKDNFKEAVLQATNLLTSGMNAKQVDDKLKESYPKLPAEARADLASKAYSYIDARTKFLEENVNYNLTGTRLTPSDNAITNSLLTTIKDFPVGQTSGGVPVRLALAQKYGVNEADVTDLKVADGTKLEPYVNTPTPVYNVNYTFKVGNNTESISIPIDVPEQHLALRDNFLKTEYANTKNPVVQADIASDFGRRQPDIMRGVSTALSTRTDFDFKIGSSDFRVYFQKNSITPILESIVDKGNKKETHQVQLPDDPLDAINTISTITGHYILNKQ
jgi:Arc/MetJ-type ribon-helix-helix transcriptional regulator